ncbi:bifunctional homocysteine S-methyltransferase/methylenetetrahydrofolate reductase [Bacteroidetes/Chlorobi group bacterium ChocPot_Mid]|nr:MAG: bifunctional homocysteine S-methyltransferase/methylenetetrahydrofolate reductase [Bacteroidetes/Chlorobi group bacterium ChocPot_Mid]
MITQKDFLKELNSKPLLFDGAMGTEIYKRGVFINKCYDELNLTNPNLIKQIHIDYKKAGADVIETNTFGANRYKLKNHLLQDKVYEINFQAASIALEVADNEIYVAGAIGPLGVQMEPLGPLAKEEAVEAFEEQAKALLEGGVNLFVLETFIYPEELNQAIIAVRKICDLPIIAMMTIDEAGNSLTGASPEVFVKQLESYGADVIGVNCTVGPHRMLNWLEKSRGFTNLPLAVMPNAGKPRNIDGRNIYLTSPEYLGEYAKHFIQTGANIIGGCCGTSPEHIKAMRNSLNAIRPNYRKINITSIEKIILPDVKVIEQENKSRLASRVKNGYFIKLVELLAPHGVSATSEIDKARNLYYQGIDAINIPDGPRASARMSALSLALQIQREVGIEAVLHYVCRDRNVIGIQSDLLGAYALGIKNILAITGDPPKLGNYPDATGVFDVDSIGLVNILNRLNHGLDIAGNPIGKPSAFFVGVGANPGAINLDEEIKRLEWKVDAGAEFIITQPIFDIKILENFIKRIEHIRRPLIAGLWPLTSIRNAEFMNNEVPGCNVPENIMNRLRKVEDSKEKSLQEGISIARETLHEMLGEIQGIQISAPFGRIQSVFDVLDGFVFK